MYSQNEANNWYFGDQAGITFNNGTPEALTDGVMYTDEGCATISDSTGELLFYTDGITIYNSDHNVMQNGTGLLGDFSSTQSAIIVPQPNNPNIYYVFTVDEIGGTDGLRYSIVDMSLDGGLGGITSSKNILLVTPVSEKINAVLHANGQDIWVITHGYGNDEFYAYLITASGINITPIVSSTGVFIPDNNFFNTIGVLKASPNGNKLVMCVRDIASQVFNFNSGTGIVDNPVDIYVGLSSLGAEFSPSGNVLYVTHNFDRLGLWQYDLTSSDIINTAQLIYQVPDNNPSLELGQLQLGVDSKIYVSIRNSEYLSAINHPEVIGVGCNFNSNAIYLEGNICKYGLPTFIQSYFFVGFQADDVCEGEVTQFNANISQAYDNLLWDFGDGTTSTEENPNHTYVNAGNYDVSLSVTSGSDSSVDTKTITVYEVPVTSPVVLLRQCDDDLDGYSSFNLTEVNAEISANHQDETITFHETQQDAENDDNPITQTTDYTNQTVSSDVIWARVENNFGCYAISEVNLVVSTTQIPDTFIRDFYQCDDGLDTSDGIATFNFSSVTSDIEALFPVGQQLDIVYYRNEVDALSETNPITDINNYENIGFPNTQDVYVRVDDAQNNDCLGLGHHITLYVDSIPIANAVSIDVQCDSDGDGIYDFDTSFVESTLINGQNNVSVAYYDAQGTQLSSPLPNPFSTATQDITARVINSNSQDPDGSCYDETVISFVVQEAVVAHSIGDFVACDDDNDGFYAFDTSSIEASVLNGQVGMNVSYKDENGNALPSPLPNPFNTQNQTITVKVENNLSSNCYDETQISFNIYEQPIAYPVTDDFVCNDSSNNSEHTFYLSDYDAQVLNGQTGTDFNISYFTSIENAEDYDIPLPNAFTISDNLQTIYARIENNNNIGCYDITSFQIGVSYLPIANQPSDLMLCDDDVDNGVEIFDLSLQNTSILLGLSLSNNNLTFHLSQVDADQNLNPIDTNYENIVNPQLIYARLENANNTNCYTTTSFSLIVQEKPILTMYDQVPICENDTVELVADFGYDQYIWSTGENTRNIFVNEPGFYTVTASNIYGDLICSTQKTVTVNLSEIAIITDIEMVDWSQTNNSISVFVEGNGDYEYSIDGINYQHNNTFSGLGAEEYIVYVRDKNGCGIIHEEVYLLYYPRFFTPNGDGDNDFWQIKNSAREPLNKLYIYDRYGKLIVQLQPNDFGWDGTYNGNRLPSSDYWFVLERQNGKIYTGHFALKR